MRLLVPLLTAMIALAGCDRGPATPSTLPSPSAGTAARPDLALLTSLPIVFGENFGLETPASPLLQKLDARFRVRPVDGPEQLARGGLLLAIQPQALTAERLVALDAWVRDGGRLVLLADPRLVWESKRPLGDHFRPPVVFPDTGLLQRWGLELAPEIDNPAEAVDVDLGGGVQTSISGMGRLNRRSGSCSLSTGGRAAWCRLGQGHAIVVADADFAMSPLAEHQQALVALVQRINR